MTKPETKPSPTVQPAPVKTEDAPVEQYPDAVSRQNFSKEVSEEKEEKE